MESSHGKKGRWRVLLITDTYNPCVGGAEKCFFTLKEALSKRGYEVFSLGFSSKRNESSTSLILKENNSAFMRQFWRLFCNPVKYVQMRRFVKKVKPDIIHLYNINKYTPSLLWAVRGYPVVHTVNDYGLLCPTMWNIHADGRECRTGIRRQCISEHRMGYPWLVYLALLLSFWEKRWLVKKLSKAFIVSTRRLQRYLELNGFKNVHHSSNMIDLKRNDGGHFEKIKDHNLLYVGQLEENKGVSLLIRAVAEVKPDVPDLVLKIAGTGSEKERLTGLVRQLSLEKNVVFLGRVENLTDLFHECLAVVIPSLWMENSPVIIQDAMMHCRAVIGSRRGGIPEMIADKKSGLLFDPLKEGALAEKMLVLLKDRKKARAYGIAARRMVEQSADRQKQMADIENIYSQLV